MKNTKLKKELKEFLEKVINEFDYQDLDEFVYYLTEQETDFEDEVKFDEIAGELLEQSCALCRKVRISFDN